LSAASAFCVNCAVFAHHRRELEKKIERRVEEPVIVDLRHSLDAKLT